MPAQPPPTEPRPTATVRSPSSTETKTCSGAESSSVVAIGGSGSPPWRVGGGRAAVGVDREPRGVRLRVEPDVKATGSVRPRGAERGGRRGEDEGAAARD